MFSGPRTYFCRSVSSGMTSSMLRPASWANFSKPTGFVASCAAMGVASNRGCSVIANDLLGPGAQSSQIQNKGLTSAQTPGQAKVDFMENTPNLFRHKRKYRQAFPNRLASLAKCGHSESSDAGLASVPNRLFFTASSGTGKTDRFCEFIACSDSFLPRKVRREHARRHACASACEDPDGDRAWCRSVYPDPFARRAPVR